MRPERKCTRRDPSASRYEIALSPFEAAAVPMLRCRLIQAMLRKQPYASLSRHLAVWVCVGKRVTRKEIQRSQESPLLLAEETSDWGEKGVEDRGSMEEGASLVVDILLYASRRRRQASAGPLSQWRRRQ